MKKLQKLFISVFFIAVVLFTGVRSVRAESWPSFGVTKSIRAYTISTGNTPAYSNSALSKKSGTIYASDELYIYSIGINGKGTRYCLLSYPTSKGRRYAYTPLSAVTPASYPSEKYTSRAAITSYKRASTSLRAGSISKGDNVYKLSVSGSYTQVLYNLGSAGNPSGWRMAWITTSNYNNYVKTAANNNNTSVYVRNGTYTIYAGHTSNKVVDVNGNNSADGTNVAIYEVNGTDAQVFDITSIGSGWYKIITKTGKALDVKNGEARSGANVQIWSWNNTDAQKWRFIDAGSGYYYIQNKLGYYLDVDNYGTANSTNILVYNRTNGNNQKWKLSLPPAIPSYIKEGTYMIYAAHARNKVVDVAGNNNYDGVNVALYEANRTNAQLFDITHLGNGWYKIANVNGRVLDVNGGVAGNGVNVQIWSWNNTDAQKWRFLATGSGSYYIQNKVGYYLDVYGAGNANSTNIQVYSKNYADNQRWNLVECQRPQTVSWKTYYVTTTAGLNMRQNASTSSAKIQVIPFRAAVQVASIQNGWAYCQYNGKQGYCDSNYLSETQVSSNNWDSLVGKTVAAINSYYYKSGNISYNAGYKGQCTWYAYGRFYEVNGIALGSARHAKYWLSDNKNKTNVKVVYSIQPKCIAVRTTGTWGHVMFVEEVTYSGNTPVWVYYTECNDDGNGVYNEGKDCIVKKLSYSDFIKKKNPAGYIVKK